MVIIMELIVVETELEFARTAAAEVSRQVIVKPESLIGLATGNTTIDIFNWMVRLHEELGIDYSRCKTCNLDEYAGVAPEAPASCRYRINEQLLGKININIENTYVPNGLCAPPEKELDVFRETVERFGGIDLQVLSIGGNGHIAFNEPGTPFESTYRIAPISDSTIRAKASLFGGEDKVPRYGITMGIKDICLAKKILLVAKGRHKAEAISKVVNGPLTEDIPATVLMLHPNLTIIVDRAAASKI